jgi:hypothetical protein
MHDAISWAIRQIRINLGPLIGLVALACLAWLLAARGLAGWRRALWLLVPVLFAAALVCVIGPGRLFPKKPFEGPILLTVSHNHALTLLDIPGFLWASIAVALGGWLLRDRLRSPGR